MMICESPENIALVLKIVMKFNALSNSLLYLMIEFLTVLMTTVVVAYLVDNNRRKGLFVAAYAYTHGERDIF